MNFTSSLLRWFDLHKRKLPWKDTSDPYAIWLSEIILQQTRVSQGLPYFERFMKRFPTVSHLADANEDDVLKLWEGLGYYSRARNLHHAAKTIVNQYQGQFPSTYAGLIGIKGVGSYTAAAILSFAYNQPYAAIDGNALRIASRYLGLTAPIDANETKKQIETWLQTQLPPKKPGDFNQAMMDLGSLVCTPKSPLCSECPLQNGCAAYAQNLVDVIPFKAKTIEKRDRYFHYLVVVDSRQNFVIHKRTDKDIWSGLFEFPLIESKSIRALSQQKIENTVNQWSKSKLKVEDCQSLETFRHILTHQRIFAKFYWVKIKSLKISTFSTDYNLVNPENITNFAFPKLIQNFIQNHLVNLMD